MRKVFILVVIGLFGPLVRADQFDSIDGKSLAALIKSPDVKAVYKLTIADLGALSNVLKDSRASFLVAETADGNLARILITPELRKPTDGPGEPFPVFVIERFDTFDGSDLSLRVGKGRDITVYPGFHVDLDSGGIVPEAQGADLAFKANALVSLKGAKLFTVSKAPVPDPTRGRVPTPGRTVVPADFAGRYRLFANGQWSGLLELEVEGTKITGTFRSDAQGTLYNVKGEVATDPKNRATFTIKFPRSQGELDVYLWTDEKGAFAGSFRLLDRVFGIFAVRENARFAPQGTEARLVTGEPEAEPAAIKIVGAGVEFRGKTMTIENFAALSIGMKSVTIQAAKHVPFATLARLIEALRKSGIQAIRITES